MNMNKSAKNEEMDAKVSVNGQMVYVFYEADDYYLVSLNADGTGRFKADKMIPGK
jgi:hypothetical protein